MPSAVLSLNCLPSLSKTGSANSLNLLLINDWGSLSYIASKLFLKKVSYDSFVPTKVFKGFKIVNSFYQKYLLPGLVFQGIVIGGGYATGRELAEFFMPHGFLGGLLSMLVA